MLAQPNTQDKGVAQKRSDNGEEKFKCCMLINSILGNFCHLNYLFQKIHPCDKEFGPRSGHKRNKSADSKSPVKQTFEQIICLYPCWIILHYRKLLCTSFFSLHTYTIFVINQETDRNNCSMLIVTKTTALYLGDIPPG